VRVFHLVSLSKHLTLAVGETASEFLFWFCVVLGWFSGWFSFPYYQVISQYFLG
jgi:hypothetical protein